jgi:hypothetical protein
MTEELMTEELLPLSSVAFSPPFPNPAPTDALSQLAWLDIRDLFIDPRYQRPINARGEKNIRQVIENFSWSLFSPIVVCRRSKGRYAVIDGQHRAIAALTHGGIERVPALVINGTLHDEAKAFSVINGAVTAILPTQIWHARVVGEEYDAVMLQRVFSAVGVVILRSSKALGSYNKGETVAIDALEAAYKRYGKGALTLALRTVLDTAPSGNPGYIRAPLIKATCEVLVNNPAIFVRADDVLTAVRTVGIPRLWHRAEARRSSTAPKLTVYASYAAVLLEALQQEMKIG